MRIVLVNLFEFEVINLRIKEKEVDELLEAPPIGLMTLAAVVEQQGHEVELVDFVEPIVKGELPYDSTLTRVAAEYIYQYRGDIVGFTSRCDCYHYTLDMMRHYRELDPETPLVLGGPQATITAQSTMQHFPFVDYLVLYEGDRTFPQLLEALQHDVGCERVNGIAFRRNGKVIFTPKAELIKNLDEIPIPAYKFYPPQYDLAHVEVGRGCPFHCTFCSTSLFFARSFRLKSPDRLVQEIRFLMDTYGIKRVSFIHDMFTANMRKVRAICQRLIEARLGITWGCSARIDCVNPKLLELMHQSGCESIYFGIESGSPRIQKLIKKGLDVEKVIPILNVCHRLGIRTTTSFITGFPEETPADINQTMKMLLECACTGAETTQLHLFSPYPGTPIMEEVRDRLIFTGYVSDAAYAEAPTDSDYDELIRSLPELFCSYFQAVPEHVSLKTLQGLDMFGYALQPLRHTIFCLLKEGASETIFDIWLSLRAWLDEHEKSLTQDQVYGAKTIKTVAQFLSEHFFTNRDRFPISYEAFKYDMATIRLVDFPTPRNYSAANGVTDGSISPEVVPCLRQNMVIVHFRCNIHELLKSVRYLQFPRLYLSPEDQPAAIVQQRSASRRRLARVIPLTQWMVAVLRRCNSRRSVRQIIEDIWVHEPIAIGTSFKQCERRCLCVIKRLVMDRLIVLSPAINGVAVEPSTEVLVRISEIPPFRAGTLS